MGAYQFYFNFSLLSLSPLKRLLTHPFNSQSYHRVLLCFHEPLTGFLVLCVKLSELFWCHSSLRCYSYEGCQELRCVNVGSLPSVSIIRINVFYEGYVTLEDRGNLNCVCLTIHVILIIKGVREGFHCGGLAV